MPASPEFESQSHPLWSEVRYVLGLAIPVALAELGWMAMGVVDTIMIGPLGPVAIGAIAIGASAFYAFAIFGLGLLLGLDTLVSQAHGAGQPQEGRRALAQGVYLTLLLTPPLMLLFYWLPALFPLLRIEPEVSSAAAIFLRVLNWSVFPLLLHTAFRRYLQATGHARPVTFVLITANLINWFFNWLLISGHWGFPALGVAGSALSTGLARTYMALMLGAAAFWFDRHTFRALLQPPDWQQMRDLISIGLPAALQIMLEIGAFGAAAFIAGRLSATALAAHQIAINVASVSYMVPLGISSAAAITVGHASGAGLPLVARKRGFIALGTSVAFAVAAATLFATFPLAIIGFYTSDSGILLIGRNLLLFAAAFQLFDGIQAVTTGALRGLGNTRAAMLINLAGYWVFGLPVGALLCFRFGQGIYGIWSGLTLALVLIAICLLLFWQRLSAAGEPVKS